ncbi:MAG TPA: HepT-like ribonuclease domain-containing protein [Thermomicrobiales bacterium]|jgi:uncharacterized protein with HEPN domain|nr:HepT-like ribonuclease domain-containing protein [Thermomicrobiales bacterium]
MNESTALSLLDAYDAALELELMVRGIPLQEYLSDRKLHLAAENLLIKTGEALSQARKQDAAILDEMSSAYAVVGIRNFVIHDYRMVDEETIWSTAVGEIPLLRAELAHVLVRMGYEVDVPD